MTCLATRSDRRPRPGALKHSRGEPARWHRRRGPGRGQALLDGRDDVIPEDVKAVAEPALSHRPLLRPQLWVRRITGEDIVTDLLAEVPTPPTRAHVSAEPAP